MKTVFALTDAMIAAVLTLAGVRASVPTVTDARRVLDAQKDRLIQTAEYAAPLFLTEELVNLEMAKILCESRLITEDERARVDEQCLVF